MRCASCDKQLLDAEQHWSETYGGQFCCECAYAAVAAERARAAKMEREIETAKAGHATFEARVEQAFREGDADFADRCDALQKKLDAALTRAAKTERERDEAAEHARGTNADYLAERELRLAAEARAAEMKRQRDEARTIALETCDEHAQRIAKHEGTIAMMRATADRRKAAEGDLRAAVEWARAALASPKEE